MLLLMAYSLYHSDFTPAVSAAIGIEMYHNHTLVHDASWTTPMCATVARPSTSAGTKTPPCSRATPMLLLAYRLIAQSTVGRRTK